MAANRILDRHYLAALAASQQLGLSKIFRVGN